ncbi:MAG: RHS repeat protein, partial [Phaeodactylibacter sp.]|nr:RHS repeat protein [Phaeodactylibacter sp.]
SIPLPEAADFFTPGNYTPGNLNLHPGAADANFDQYQQRSFLIPGRGLDLEFEHHYNSYLTELPEELFCIWQNGNWQSFQPLGPGWSHSYHAYLLEIPGWSHNGLTQADLSVIVWPRGEMQVYEKDGTQLTPLSEGIYQDILYDPNTSSYTITRKDQVVFRFEQKNLSNPNWPLVLTAITDRNGNQINLQYEPFSGAGLRLKEVTGTCGRKLKFSYFPNSARISAVEDPLGRSVSFTFGGPSGEDLQSYRDAADYQTVYNYSTEEGQAHLLRTVTLPNGNFIFNTYEDRKLRASSLNNSASGVITQQDINWDLSPGTQGGTTSNLTIQAGTNSYNYGFEKNAQGKLSALTAPMANSNLSYDDPLHPTLPTTIEVNGLSSSYTYDPMGNILQVDQELNVSHQFTYTSMNDVATYTDPKGQTTSYSYTNGNLSMVATPVGVSTFTHNSYGQPKSSTNPEGITTTYEYDNYGQVKALKMPLGINHLRSYDAAGRPTLLTDANGQSTTVEYDDRDLIQKITNPLGQVTQYLFDGNRNLTEIINAQDNSTLLTYNYFDWLSSVSFAGDTQQFEYDQEGKLAKITRPDGTALFYTYFNNGNLADDGYAVFTYDSKNRLKTVSKDGLTLSLNYDDLNRITSTTYDQQTVTYQYDPNSNLKKMIYPGNLVVDYTYDADNRLKTVKDWNDQLTTYHYLDDGRLEETDFPNGTTTAYFYDAAGRLDSMVHSSGTTIIAAYGFTLDPQGNIIHESKTEPLSWPTWTAAAKLSTYNSDNTLATVNGQSYSSNPNGALTGLPNRSISWDAHDMPASISGDLTAAFGYDGLGNRRAATVNGLTRKFVLDILGSSKVLLETDINNNPLHYYIYGLDLIARIAPDNTTHYYHGDFRGSTIAMTDAGGTVTHSYQYGPFGAVLQKQEPDSNPFQYAGKLGVMADDDELYFMRARYYDPTQGRFLSEDPVWSNNLYKYAGNNPIAFTDPRGTFSQALA